MFIASQKHHKVCRSITVTCVSEWFFRVAGESNLPIFFYGTEGVLRSIKSVFSLIGWLKYNTKIVMNSNEGEARRCHIGGRSHIILMWGSFSDS